jgi:hypothetical protein
MVKKPIRLKTKRNHHSRFDVGFSETNEIILQSEATSLFDVQRSMFDDGRSSFNILNVHLSKQFCMA